MFEVANINRASTRDFWITVNLIFDKTKTVIFDRIR